MRIGILMTGHVPEELVPEVGEYPDMFASLLDGHGFTFRSWAVVDGEFPPGVDAADGWLITGSRHGAYENHAWIPPLEAFIRAVHARGRPLVGICFGHQIVAQALGGTVEKFAGGWAVGRTIYDIDGENLALNAWHQDQVTVPPKDAQVVGSSEFCENAALLYGDSIYTIQPHPEFDARYVQDLLRIRGHLLPPERIADATRTLSHPTDNAAFAEKIADFFLRQRET